MIQPALRKSLLWASVKQTAVSTFEVLSRTVWPLHLGCLLAVIGVMASLLANIFSIAWDPGSPNPKNQIVNQLYILWQLCTVMIVTLLLSMLLTLVHSIYMQSQKDLIATGKLSVVDWFFNTLFLFICFLFPSLTIGTGLYSIRTLNHALQSYLQITPQIIRKSNGNKDIWDAIVWIFRLLGHNWGISAAVAIVIISFILIARTYTALRKHVP